MIPLINFGHLWLFGIGCQQHISNKLGQGTQKTESCGMLLKHLSGTFHKLTGSLVTGDCFMIGSETGLRKAPSFMSTDEV